MSPSSKSQLFTCKYLTCLNSESYMERWVVGAKYVHSEASVRCLVTVDSRIRLAVVSTASDM